MKRYMLWALFALMAIAAALFPSGQALAQQVWGPITLVPTSAKPGDSGTATLTNVSGPRWTNESPGVAQPLYGDHLWAACFWGDLSVDCHGLTPGKTYRIGPTAMSFPWNTNNRQKVEYYSSGKKNQNEYYSFTASADGSGGTAGSPVRVQFYVVWQWQENPYGGGGSYYRISPDGYAFSVARKVGKEWTASLTGFFPNPAYPQ